uniref:Uncharacterized protein n=1 Tax=Neoizziella asiatica TaxID=1077397 RepID=A0A1G4NWW4_9FLOR|nr:Hypothetical protein ORF_2 [Neoizziella asiatica]SCW23152.1 Hypothetical protein ORF_2 [Neoizziella asiatica]
MPFILSSHTLNHSFPNDILKVPTYSTVHRLSSTEHSTSKLLIKSQSRCKTRQLIVAADSIYRFSKLQEHQSKLFRELLDKYWRQTIFISNASPIVRKYSALLAKQEEILLKSSKKKFMSNLSKALQKGEVYADFNDRSVQDQQYDQGSVRYIWGKSLNVRFPKHWDGLWANKRVTSQPKSSALKRTLMSNLHNNNFPVFVLANSLNQIVVAEPSSQVIHQSNIFHKVYLWYYDRFLWQKDDNSVYEGWFFVNPKDAEEYANFVKSRYPRSAQQNGLAVLPTTLETYYNLNRSAPPRTEFRLFPDLEEVGRLTVSSKYRKGLSFDKRQNYGRRYFQGQPVYFIKAVSGTNRKTGLKDDVNYYYQIPGDISGQKYTGIFFDKTVACNAWKHFRNLNPNLKLPIQPKLEVYNLEDFMKDYEYNRHLLANNFLFIPSEDTYRYVKSINSNQSANNHILLKHFALYKFSVSLWVQRLVWSLTSGQPPH